MAHRAPELERIRWLITIGLVALLYYGAARLGLLMGHLHKNISPVWPPSGFALAAMLVLGWRIWPAISIGAFLANFSTGLAFPTALAIGVGNTLEAASGYYLLLRIGGFDNKLERVRDALALIVFGAILSPAVAATIGVASLLAGGYILPTGTSSGWWTWWLGDGMGILVVAPLLLTWAATPVSLGWLRKPAGIPRLLEAAVLLASLVAVTQFIFDGGRQYPYAVFPLLVWAAMRFSQRGAATTVIVVSGLAVWGTLQGFGPFVRSTPEHSLDYLQTFTGVVALMTLVLGAAASERAQGERRQAELLAEVQIQRKRLDGILATLPAIVWEAYGEPDSAAQRINFVSDYIHTLLGYSAEQWLSEPNFWLKIVHPDDKENAARVAAEAFASGQPHNNLFRWIAKDGGVLWSEAHSITIFDSSGAPIGMRGVNIDATDRKRAEEERERLVAELQQRQADIESLNERLRRTVAETHHRVKNNLQVICALAEMQVLQGTELVSAKELSRIGQHTRSLAIIHDILTREAKTESGAERIMIKDAMEQLAPLLQSVVGDRRLLFEIQSVSVPVRHGTAMTVLVNELVSNALKHGAGDIRISLSVVNGTGRLEVSDEGPGFPDGFDSSNGTSTGMELIDSLSRWDLGGELTFVNRPEGGACVVVTFPLEEPTEAVNAHNG